MNSGNANLKMTRGKKVAIHQPNYLPWLGYFAKIKKCDIFVFLDDVQFSKNSWQNRVHIKSPNGKQFLTQPLNKHEICFNQFARQSNLKPKLCEELFS